MNKVSSKRKGPGYPAGKPRKYPAVDFSAALEQAPSQQPPHQVQAKGREEIDFSAAVPKTHPGATSQPSGPHLPADTTTNINNNTILDSSVSKKNQFSIKSLLTVKELNFLEYFISGEYTIEEAMISAGYIGYHQKSLYRISRRIVEKYESAAPDAKKIFRDIGFGELSVAKGIKRLAQKGRSEVVQLNAHALAAKCLQMTQEAPLLNVGFQVVIKCSQEEQALEPGRVRPATIWLKEQEALADKTKEALSKPSQG